MTAGQIKQFIDFVRAVVTDSSISFAQAQALISNSDRVGQFKQGFKNLLNRSIRNPSLEIRRLSELAQAVIDQLLKLDPDLDLNPERLRYLVKHPENLKSMLDEAFIFVIPELYLYPIVVDYDIDLEEAIKPFEFSKCSRCYRSYVRPDITPKNFPTLQTGKAKLVVELFSSANIFDDVKKIKKMSATQVLRRLDKIGYRPAELRELLALAVTHPKVMQERQILALGSIWHEMCWDRYHIPFVYERSSDMAKAYGTVDVQRELGLLSEYHKMPSVTYFFVQGGKAQYSRDMLFAAIRK